MIAKSIERIHRANLVNFGIVPFIFDDPKAYEKIAAGDKLELVNVKAAVEGSGQVEVEVGGGQWKFTATTSLSERERHVILSGGLLASL